MRKTYCAHLLVLTALLLYARSLVFDFTYDDIWQITQNPQVSGTSWERPEIIKDFFSPNLPGNLYRPITTLTYKITWLLFGQNSYPLHFTNILLYALATVLVYVLFLKITKNEPVSFISGLIFVVHPMHVEAVANIVGRAEILSTVLGLGAVISFMNGPAARSPLRMTLHSLLSASLFLGAMLSKESAITLFPLIPFAAFFALGWQIPDKKERILRIIPGCSALLGSVVIALFLRTSVLGPNALFNPGKEIWAENPISHLGFSERIIPGLYILGNYLQKLLLPFGLSADYSTSPEAFFGKLYSWHGALIFILLTSIFLFAYGSRPLIKFFFFWFISTFLLTLNIFFPIGTLMGDRLAFLPSIGLIIFLILSVSQYLQNKIIGVWILSLYITILTFITCSKIPIWKNNATLFHQTVIDSPSSPKAHYNLCAEQFSREQNLEAAELSCRKALTLFPTSLPTLRLLSEIALRKNEYRTLEVWYKKILLLTPNDQEVKNNLDTLLNWKEQLKREQK